jgi:hypothetical protein
MAGPDSGGETGARGEKRMNEAAKVMTPDRRIVEVNSAWMQDSATLLDYVQAKDGVWVPKCDLAQYEAGDRPLVAQNPDV